MAHARLARRIGEKGRIEQRDQRGLDRLGGAVGLTREDRPEDGVLPNRSLGTEVVATELAGQGRDQCSRQGEAAAGAVLVRKVRDHPLDEPCEKQGQPVSRFGASKG